MNKKNFASFVAGLAVMGVVWAGVSGVQSFSSRESGRLGQRYDAIEEKIDKMDKLISSYYLNPEDIDLDKLEQGIYAGYVAGLEEDYTTYYTPEEFASVMESTSGKYSGIGAYVSQNMSTGLSLIHIYASGLAGDHAGNDLFTTVKNRSEIGLNNFIPFLGTHVAEETDMRNARVVDETVRRAENFAGSGDKSPGVLIAAHIAGEIIALASHSFNMLFYLKQIIFTFLTADTNGPAGAGKSFGDGPPDASGSTGNQDSFAYHSLFPLIYFIEYY